MTRYQNLKDEPKRFLALTGYTPEKSFLSYSVVFLNVF